jgi:hypothetical protein
VPGFLQAHPTVNFISLDVAQRVIRLEPGETKNDEARTVPLMGELGKCLTRQKQRRDQK